MSAFQLSHGSVGKTRLLGSTIFSSNFLRITLVAMSGMMAATAPADAAVFWTDEDPMVMRQVEPPAPRPQPRQKAQRRSGAKQEKLVKEKENAKPVGPLVITISIDQQKLRLYDSNGLFAETPVSTGMRGHSTPMGVFSVIQKNKYHRSNIYSGAPMPFMQRITWSGIAMHAGVLPGYPASHGCIRMPMAFATKIWGWTRMGARVIITPGEISPAEFSHPLLVAMQKPAPTPAAALDTKNAVTTAKADKSPTDTKPVELSLKPSAAPDRAKTQTADASGMITPVTAATPVMSDATPSASGDTKLMTRRDMDAEIAKVLDPTASAKPAETVAEAPAKIEFIKIEPVKIEPAKAEADRTETPKAETSKPEAPAASTTASVPDVKKDETRPADTAKDPAKADAAAVAVTPAVETTPKRTGQIAVLVSGKDNKLYVRQNFAPLFETSIVIKPSDRPLGTHVFTARVDKDDAKRVHWTAVSLPSVPRRAVEDEKASRRRKTTGAIEVKPLPLPDSASEALDRLTIPADAMAQIADALGTGGSITVSDQGISAGGETGQGTEFVVPLR